MRPDRKASDDEDVQVAGNAASWMVTICTYPLRGGSAMDRSACLGAINGGASIIGTHLYESRSREAFAAFIDALGANSYSSAFAFRTGVFSQAPLSPQPCP